MQLNLGASEFDFEAMLMSNAITSYEFRQQA